MRTNQEIHLAARPIGLPTEANFSLVTTELPALRDGEVLVRNRFFSVDPYMRGRMNGGTSYVSPFEVGAVLDGGAVGEVIESRSEHLAVGAVVVSGLGWRTHFQTTPDQLLVVQQPQQPLSIYLGALGMTGMTAWAGLNLVEVASGDTIFISGAAGAVGSVAGQLAKLRGCTVIGSAGSAEKCAFLRDECGFDAAFNYKDGPILEQLRAAAPTGIDVYFDNVGGESLEAALTVLRNHGRIIACGGISSYNAEAPTPGPSNLFYMVTKRLTMKGLIVSDWLSQRSAFESEVGAYIFEGKLKSKETVVFGIENAPRAFLGLFSGENIGKMVVAL